MGKSEKKKQAKRWKSKENRKSFHELKSKRNWKTPSKSHSKRNKNEKHTYISQKRKAIGDGSV